MVDFASLTNDALRASGKQALSNEDIVKVASVAARILQNETEARQKIAMTKLSRAQEVKSFVLERIEKISAVTALAQLHRAGAQLSDEVVNALPQLIKEAMADADAIGDAVAEGDGYERELMEALIEGAAQDPEAGAELAARAGDEMSPEEVENAAMMLAEAIMDEESGEGETKVAMQKKSSLRSFAKQASPYTTAMLQRRAELLIAAALENVR